MVRDPGKPRRRRRLEPVRGHPHRPRGGDPGRHGDGGECERRSRLRRAGRVRARARLRAGHRRAGHRQSCRCHLERRAHARAPRRGRRGAPASWMLLRRLATRARGRETSAARRRRPKSATPSRRTGRVSVAARTLTRRIIEEHLAGETDEEIALHVDQILLEDATGTMACLQFERLGANRVAVPTVSYVDHNVIQFDHRNPDDHVYLRSFAERYGLLYSPPGNGISHYLHLERFARPGEMLLGADSHTTMAGALTMLAVGAGGTEVALAMTGRPYSSSARWSSVSSSSATSSRGCSRRTWCSSSFAGAASVEAAAASSSSTARVSPRLSATDRGTICNMVMETGATTGIFPSDASRATWLEQQGRGEHFVELAADRGRRYDESERIDLSALEPLIARPVVTGERRSGARGGRHADDAGLRGKLRELVLRGSSRSWQRCYGGRVAPGSRSDRHAGIAPDPRPDRAQRRVLRPARRGRADPRARLRAVHRRTAAPASGAVSVRTFNRNFPGRAAPRTTVSTSALRRRRPRRRFAARSPTRAIWATVPELRPFRRPTRKSTIARSSFAAPRTMRRASRSCGRRTSCRRPRSAAARTHRGSRADRRSGRRRRPATWHLTARSASRSGRTSRPAPATCSAASTPTSRLGPRSGAAASSSAATTTGRARAASRLRLPFSSSAFAPSSRRASPASTGRTSSRRASCRSSSSTRRDYDRVERGHGRGGFPSTSESEIEAETPFGPGAARCCG